MAKSRIVRGAQAKRTAEKMLARAEREISEQRRKTGLLRGVREMRSALDTVRQSIGNVDANIRRSLQSDSCEGAVQLLGGAAYQAGIAVEGAIRTGAGYSEDPSSPYQSMKFKVQDTVRMTKNACGIK